MSGNKAAQPNCAAQWLTVIGYQLTVIGYWLTVKA